MTLGKQRIYGTIEENMFYALQEEQHMINCGPLDPYYRSAKKNVEYYLECAAALERGEQEITVKPSMR